MPLSTPPEDVDEAKERHASAVEEARNLMRGTLAGPPTEEQREVQEYLVNEYTKAAHATLMALAPSRARSVALTQLQTAKMFAVAAIYEETSR